ncbi:MAG: CRTAC1 family protein [Flavobacteriales bacterium]|nr:CRTAC1 family protein [Flavobacteriales bacterium]
MSQVVFEEISEQLGVTHMHQFAPRIGGGVACFDFNNDGWEDIYLCGGETTDKLYQNDGDGSFTDVSIASGISTVANITTTGVVTGDVDNDGFRDIVLTTFFGSEIILLHNNGDGTFTKLSDSAIPDTPNWTSAASFGDFDKDGLLDLYVVSYVFNASFIHDSLGNTIGYNHDCDPNHLYRNNGDLTFTDVTNGYALGDEGCALATAFTDFDNDQDVDIVLVNDFGEWVLPSLLYQNDLQTQSFEEVSVALNMHHEMYGMGVAIGDYDRDADLDYYFTNIGRNVLDRNMGGVFQDWATEADVENDSANGYNTTSWGCFFFDADNDGWIDLFVANGQIPALEFNQTTPYDPNKLFLNNGDGSFSDISVSAHVDGTRIARGAACADFDNDGRMDIVVNNTHWLADSTQIELYHNVSTSSNNWLKVLLHGTESNRDAFGAHVRLVVDGFSTLVEVDGGSSHASQNTSVLHFGLGSSSVADSVIVTFPSGVMDILVNVDANQLIEVTEPSITVNVDENDQRCEISNVCFSGQSIRFNSYAEPGMKFHIGIFDIAGRLIVQELMTNVDNGQNEFFLPTFLPSGIYMIQFQFINEKGFAGKSSFKLINTNH